MFEEMLSGGHHNSLGRTEEVVECVLADRALMAELYQCYFSEDELVRLRVSSAMKRIAIAHPDWTMDFMDGLQGEIAEIDQASNQWTLALLFDLTKELMSAEQKARALSIMKVNVAGHDDWIVLNNSMQVLFDWSGEVDGLDEWLKPHLQRLTRESRKSVAARAGKLLAKLT